MKKNLILLLLTVYLVTSITPSVFANVQQDKHVITSVDQSILEKNLQARNLWATNFVVDILFDSDNNPKFLLGTTSNRVWHISIS